MQELEPTWGRALSVWWLLAWRSAAWFVLFGIALVVAGGAIIGVVATPAQMPPEVAQKVGYVVGFVSVCVSATLSPFVVRMALKKRYGDFRIALVPEAMMDCRHDPYGARETPQRSGHRPDCR